MAAVARIAAAARRDRRIDALGSRVHLAPNRQHEFIADHMGFFVDGLVHGRIEHHLGHAVAVSQVDKYDAAMIAAAGYHYLQEGRRGKLDDDVYSRVPL